MENQMDVYRETNAEKYVDKKKWIIAVVCIIIALVSFFAISKWATSVDTYRGVLGTLNEMQRKALALTGTSTALATGAAAIPGDATTPIANKLADVAGYMVIVYVAIIVEKYLLTLTGFVTFKILLPIGFAVAAVAGFLKTEWKSFAYRMAIKCIVLGILLWCLVPTSAWVTNWINDTYDNSQSIDTSILEEEENAEEEEETQDKEDREFSVSQALSDFANQVTDAVKETGKVASEKMDEFENALNQMIESVAVMIVTTCVIPILVLMSFVWILKMVTGLNISVPTAKSLPKISKVVKKRQVKEKSYEKKR